MKTKAAKKTIKRSIGIKKSKTKKEKPNKFITEEQQKKLDVLSKKMFASSRFLNKLNKKIVIINNAIGKSYSILKTQKDDEKILNKSVIQRQVLNQTVKKANKIMVLYNKRLTANRKDFLSIPCINIKDTGKVAEVIKKLEKNVKKAITYESALSEFYETIKKEHDKLTLILKKIPIK
jgi:hypothetical protein